MRPAPLLTFPPDTFDSDAPTQSSSTSAASSLRRSNWSRAFQLIPLILLYCILAFAVYAYLLSLVLGHVVLRQRDLMKGLLYGSVFAVLWTGTSASLGIAAFSAGAAVSSDVESTARHEEVSGVYDDEHNMPLLASREQGFEEQDAEEGDQRRRRRTKRAGDEDWVMHSSATGMDDTRGRGMAAVESLKDVQAEDVHGGRGPSSRQLKSNGKARFCRKCNLFKPDRAHHCSSCGHCVRKMDHHCPWLGGGCVGHHNYKSFLLFLLNGGSLGLFVATTTFMELANFVAGGPDNFSFAPVSWAVIGFLGAILGFSVSAFGLYHLYLAANNQTTIESMERSPTYAVHLSHSFPLRPTFSSTAPRVYPLSHSQRKSLRRQIARVNIYDLGAAKNLMHVFGKRWWEWPLPIFRSPGEGEYFETNEAHEMRLERLLQQLRNDDALSAATNSRGGGGNGNQSGDDVGESDSDSN